MPNKQSNSMERLNSNVREISSYSVPEIECDIMLDGNESPFVVLPEIAAEIDNRLSSISLNRYPDPNARSLREKVSGLFEIPTGNILFGNGSDELIQMLIEVFTGKSGCVLVPRPTFSMYRLTSLLLGKEVIEVDLDEDFDIDLEKTLKYISEKDPDLFFFSTPNNPSGNGFSDQSILKILESTSGIVVVDEAYFDYYGKSFLPLMTKYENLVVLRTMSKIGFASIRLGMLFASETIVKELNKARMPYNINSVTQLIAEVTVDNYSLLKTNFKTIKEERALMFKELNKIKGIQVFPSDANFFLIKVNDSDEYFSRLVEKSILVRNFNGSPLLDNCLRVTIGTPEENRKFLQEFSAISVS